MAATPAALSNGSSHFARTMPEGLTSWVVTDGKAGDEEQCLGVLERLGLEPEIRRISPRPPYSWLAPRGPIDPHDAPGRTGSPLAPPWPDLAISSGRRAVPYMRAIRRQSGGRTFTVILKDPRTGTGDADLIWTPSYDPVRGPNVTATLTSPHRLSAERLAAARTNPDDRVAALRMSRLAVLVGGNSRHLRFTEADGQRLTDLLERATDEGASLMVTVSRRTPARLRAALEQLVGRHVGFFFDGAGPNPYVSMLANADAIVVTADSVNMISEAVATGAPVLLFDLPRGASRHRVFASELQRCGAVRPFTGRFERFTYEPLDSTPIIAEAVARGLIGHRARLPAP